MHCILRIRKRQLKVLELVTEGLEELPLTGHIEVKRGRQLAINLTSFCKRIAEQESGRCFNEEALLRAVRGWKLWIAIIIHVQKGHVIQNILYCLFLALAIRASDISFIFLFVTPSLVLLNAPSLFLNLPISQSFLLSSFLGFSFCFSSCIHFPLPSISPISFFFFRFLAHCHYF